MNIAERSRREILSRAQVQDRSAPFKEGFMEGYWSGCREAAQRSLVRLLGARFGLSERDAQVYLELAEQEVRRGWSQDILSAESVEELLGL
ncbi:MAG: hypothetical protein H6741_24280 [Alphaproteobacteria bacterium]|nr:hypothetical protein [Alphaproteobacteria bacterium]